MSRLILILILLFIPWSCEKDSTIEDVKQELGILDSIRMDTIAFNNTIAVDSIFVPMVDVLGLWELGYYHSINGALWDNVPEHITHLNLTPNTCYMDTPTGGDTLVVDGWWVVTIKAFDGENMVLSRVTPDEWTELYIFYRIHF